MSVRRDPLGGALFTQAPHHARRHSPFWIAAATPLDTAGQVDTTLLGDHGRALFAQGVDGLVLFGTTGEGTSFSAAERIAVVQALLAQGIGPERLALGVGFPAIQDTIGLCRAILPLGLTQVLALPPDFYRDVTEDGLVDVYAALLDGVNDARLRLTLYNIPQVSGVRIPPEVAARLRTRYGSVVAGVKDSSADFAQFRGFRAAAPELAVTVGAEPDIGRALAEGGTNDLRHGQRHPRPGARDVPSQPAGGADAGRLRTGQRPVHCAAESDAGGAKRRGRLVECPPAVASRDAGPRH